MSSPTLKNIFIWGPLSIVKIGSPIQLYATAYYDDYSDPVITGGSFTIADTTIATVDNTGLVTGLKEGSTTISYTYNGVTSQSYELIVEDILTSISIAGNSSLLLNSTEQLLATGTWGSGFTRNVSNIVTWKSSNSSVASVNASGLVTGKISGTSNVFCLHENISSGSFPIAVEAILVSISISGTSSLNFGSTEQLSVIGTYNDGSTQNLTNVASYSSTNSGIQISASGVVTSTASGTTNISCSYQGITSNTISIQVIPILTEIFISGTSTINLGAGSQFIATGIYNDNTNKRLTIIATWSSSNTAVATANSNGVIYSVSTGSTIISCSYQGITSNTINVSIVPVLTSISISGPTSVAVGSAIQLTATGTYNDASSKDLTSSATWTSDTAQDATVSSGLVSGVAAGSANISCSYLGISATPVAITIS